MISVNKFKTVKTVSSQIDSVSYSLQRFTETRTSVCIPNNRRLIYISRDGGHVSRWINWIVYEREEQSNYTTNIDGDKTFFIVKERVTELHNGRGS